MTRPCSARWWVELIALLLVTIGANAPLLNAAEPTETIDWERQVRIANNSTQALATATKWVAAEPENTRAYLLRARLHELTPSLTNAIADYDQAIRLDPKNAGAWQARGSVRFRLAQIDGAIADFDKFISLVPEQEAHHWQRGIAYYYAGRFEAGRKQFELHQTVNRNDVENAVWHFLCVARAKDLPAARAALIPIEGDPRVPMAQVHLLFADKLKPEDVLKAATAGDPAPARRRSQSFYAHLYLGLYFEACGEVQPAREHITKAVELREAGDYMGDVANVHLQLRWPTPAAAPAKKP